MKILIEFSGLWGLGDKFDSDPMYYHLKKKYGKDTLIHSYGDNGISSHNPFWDGQKQDILYDKVIHINGFDKMPIQEYQRLTSMPSAIGHMLSYAGIDYSKVDNVTPNLYLSDNEKRVAFNKFLEKIQLRENRNLIAMCVDYYDPRRHLGIRKWDKIARILRNRGYNIVNLGLLHHLNSADIDLVGKTDIREAAAVLSYCSLFIGNDGLLFHIAQSVNVPCVCTFSLAIPQRVIFGTCPVYPVQADIKCKNCMTFNMIKVLRTQGHCLTPWGIYGRCMKMITVDMVMNKIEEALYDKENSHNLR